MWLLVALAAVLLLKAYTRKEIKKLNSRMYAARKVLREARDEEHSVAERQARVGHELERMTHRVRSMRHIIAELNARLAGADMQKVAVEETPSQGDVAGAEV